MLAGVQTREITTQTEQLSMHAAVQTEVNTSECGTQTCLDAYRRVDAAVQVEAEITTTATQTEAVYCAVIQEHVAVCAECQEDFFGSYEDYEPKKLVQSNIG